LDVGKKKRVKSIEGAEILASAITNCFVGGKEEKQKQLKLLETQAKREEMKRVQEEVT